MTYQPNPINTDNIELSPDLIKLTEKLAKNTHDVYVAGRLKEGWKYGPRRDDVKKENPTLIPYEELSESEKEYDRNTSMETVKLIIKLGYTIEKVNQ